MKSYPAILSALYNTPLVIAVEKFHEIEALIDRHARGELAIHFEGERKQPAGELVAIDSGEQFALDQVPATGSTPRQFVAVLPLFGTLFQHGDMALEASGGTSTEAWAKELKRLDANPSIKTIIIEAHTPGGQVIGTQEAADTLWAIRQAGRTRTVAVVNSQMASGGVWIGTAASEVYITPGGKMGSIGVISAHEDVSKQEEQIGVKTTLRAVPAKKILGNELAPADAEVIAAMDENNQAIYTRFLAAMARNRGVTTERVESDFGGGGMLRADEAVRAGLADGVATMAEVLDGEIARLRTSGKKSMRNQLALARARA